MPWGGSKCLDDTALGHGAVLTLFEESRQLAAQGCKVRQLAFHLGQVLPSYHVDGLTRPITLIGKAQQCVHLFDGKAQVTRPADEAQTAEMVPGIGPIIASCAGW